MHTKWIATLVAIAILGMSQMQCLVAEENKPEANPPEAAKTGASPLWDGKETQAAYAKRAGIKDAEFTLDLGNKITMEMALIPAGEFMMGDKDNKPAHKVTLTKPFYIGKYEVTQEQWQSVVGDNPSKFKEGADAEKRPVEKVSWEDINSKFLPKLAERIPKGLTARLSTEAEWEYACRAGTSTSFNTGDDESDLAAAGWYCDNSGVSYQGGLDISEFYWVKNKSNTSAGTHPVGQKKPNAWGLYDMHGNVCEWCSDWYGEYPKESEKDPVGVKSGSCHVLRGGSWFSSAKGCRSTSRGSISPGYSDYDLGFRLCLVPVVQ